MLCMAQRKKSIAKKAPKSTTTARSVDQRKAKSPAAGTPKSQAKDPRCPWCLSSELYKDYHDKEWGVPCFDPVMLFELINLEGAQAGLSWITILNKRENYRRLFNGFEPKKIVKFTPAKIDKLVANEGIVRHRGKIEAVVNNASVYLDMHMAGEPFDEFVWGFVNHKPIQNRFKKLADVPGHTEISDAMSKALKKRGFKFVGRTTTYAFMQAAGLVNDHLVSCPGHKRVKSIATR